MASHLPSRSEWSGLIRRVRHIMAREDIGVRELARRLDGVSHVSVVGWLNRQSAPSARALMRLPDALGVNGHWLLTGRGTQRIR